MSDAEHVPTEEAAFDDVLPEAPPDDIVPIAAPVKRGRKGKDERKDEAPNPIGVAYYGESFSWFQRVGEVLGFLPAFKEFYYSAKINDVKTPLTAITKAFNETIAPETFHPYPNQVRIWVRKWDADILAQMGMRDAKDIQKQGVYQVIKTRAADNAVAYDVPLEEAIESGTRTLAGELLNDALQMLRDDQDFGDMYESDELVKRRTYIVKVFAETNKMVQKKAELKLKTSADSREKASFLFELMRTATAGKVTPEHMQALKDSLGEPVHADVTIIEPTYEREPATAPVA